MNHISLLWNLHQLKKNQRKSTKEIKKLQEKKLRKLLLHAYDHSPYYSKTFEEAKISRANIKKLPLSKFPTIDKAILLENFDELITVPNLKQEELREFDAKEGVKKDTFKDEYHVVHSSGSTGKPGYFIYDNKAWGQMLLGIIRGALWDLSMKEIVKLLLDKPRIVYIAATDGRYGGAMAVGGGIEKVGAEQMFLDIKTPLSQWIEGIKKFKPNIIIGYPSAIKILGELVYDGKVEVDVMRVVSCGEPLSPGLREFFKETFCPNVMNIYGASESLALGVQTGSDESMILFDDLNYIEVEDNTMYLTALYNFVQPLIRYKISDHLVLKKPSTKSPFTQAEVILGRDEDMLWFEDGDKNWDFLHPLAVEGFCIEGLKDYQFRQIDNFSFEMLAEFSHEKHKSLIQFEMLRQMKEILKEKQMEYVQFYVRFVDEISPDVKTGKKRLILSGIENARSAV